MVKSKPSAFSWTQPACDECFEAVKLKTGRRHKVDHPQVCCYCKAACPSTAEVAHVRVNPGTVPYPTIRKDEDGNN